MTIDDIIRRGRGTAGSNGAWRVERDESDPFVGSEYSLWHYSTRMLRWRASKRYGAELLDYDIGHGSVSDQGGMNRAFRVLGLPYYYSRAGGADIIDRSAVIPADHPGIAGEHDRRAAMHAANGHSIAAAVERDLANVARRPIGGAR